MNHDEFPDLPPETVMQPCPLAWVEIELYDPSGRLRVPGEPFELSLQGQTTIAGKLDNNGFVRVNGLAPGDWTLKLPQRGFDAWHRLRSTEPPATWIEIELFDSKGKPMADEEYAVTPPNANAPITGRLDKGGRARVDVGAAGLCIVNFPKRHAPDYFPERGHRPQHLASNHG